MSVRGRTKRALALARGWRPARGLTLLTYHRVGGGSADELDTPVAAFAAQLDALREHATVVSLDAGLDRLEAGDSSGTFVITFDDGFADVHDHAWPLLRERELPFTVYLAGGLIGSSMRWEGSQAASQDAPALGWDQLAEMVESGLCTPGNHTFTHVSPEDLGSDELDRCSDVIEARLGQRPNHFAYTWGVEVPAMRAALQARFRSVATGRIGRNRVGADPLALRRLPVRRSDPLSFFRAKLNDPLLAEPAYDVVVRAAKRLGARG